MSNFDVQQWAHEEFGGCELGDRRRTERLIQVAQQVANNPSVSLPQQMETWGDLKAAYRLFDNEAVTLEAIATPHWRKTREQPPGRYLVIGFTTGEIPRPPLNLALLKGCAIVGVFYGGFAQAEPKRYDELMQELLGWLAEGRIQPVITGRYPLERAAEALRLVADRRATGKIMLTTALGRASMPEAH